MRYKRSGKDLFKTIIIFTLLYLFLQLFILYINDIKASRFFWLENKNAQSQIEAGKPAKSRLTPVVKFISDQHFWLLRAALVTCISLSFYYKKKDRKKYLTFMRISISSVLILLICSGILTWMLKIGIGKPRPYTNLFEYMHFSLSGRYHSFPSGHTTETFSYLVPLIYFSTRKMLNIILIIYGILVTFTRMPLAYHYFTDVLFGIYMTASVGFIICYFVEKRTPENWIKMP